MSDNEKRFLNKKEKNAFYLENLTEQAKRKFIDRRSFMKGAMALGLTATSALLLFQACGGDEAATTVAGPTATRERLGPTLVPPTPGEDGVAAPGETPGAVTTPTEAPTEGPDGPQSR